MQFRGFTSLRSRLAAQFAALFAIAMLTLAAALYGVTERQAQNSASHQLTSTGAVYDRLWNGRAQQLQLAASLLAHDYGFRSAVATQDSATAASALENLQMRIGARSAFILSADGRPYAGSELPDPQQATVLWDAFEEGRLVGVAQIGGNSRQVVAAPIMAPQLLGWIVFPTDLDQMQMNELEKLSPVSITAGIIATGTDKRWNRLAGRIAFDSARDSETVTSALNQSNGSLADWTRDSFTEFKPLPTLSNNQQAALMLVYPRSLAMADYRTIQTAILVFAFCGLLLFGAASWKMASRITKPLVGLDSAVHRIAQGHRELVPVAGRDELARLSSSFNDMVGQIEERETRIRHLAFNDVLTGLPNRIKFQEHAEFLLNRAGPGSDDLVLFCLDLDNFKAINDTMGHSTGDLYLKAIGERLREVCSGHFVARLGGDEFVVLASLSDSSNESELLATRIVIAIAQDLEIDGQTLRPSTSVGIAMSGNDGSDIETLLRNGDLALYRAKEAGRGTWCFFEEALNERAQAHRRIESGLRLAIERGEFELYFQPLFDLKANKITACEALIRWHHPEQGMISPLEFIPVAEATGMIVEIGSWVLREACRIAAGWPDSIRIAVNVSAIQFVRPGLSDVIVQALAASGLEARRLEIEITESIFLEDSDSTLTILHGLRSLGVRVALDDFGTGYSSLSYLQSFPFDKIKIDRSFIQQLTTRPGAGAVVKAITDLAAALGMETTAEGVEETEQLDRLRAHGCTSIQGFLFSKPLTGKALLRMITENSAAKEDIASAA